MKPHYKPEHEEQSLVLMMIQNRELENQGETVWSLLQNESWGS